jgi:flagellar motor switch protein FliG
MQKRTDYESLTGTEKAAALLLTLGEEYTGKIFQMLEESEIIEISQKMITLGTVTAPVVERLFGEFAEGIASSGNIIGNMDSTERLLKNAMSRDQASRVLDELAGPVGRTMWDKLSNVNEEIMANYLKNEYPQTVAVILSKIRLEQASKILSLLPQNFAMDVLQRLLKIEVVQREVIMEVEKTLRNEFMNNLTRSSQRDSHELVAEIFSYMDRGVEQRFFATLTEVNPESAEKIKSLMFKFEDLSKLDPNSFQTLLRNIDKSNLALALKGASDTLKNLFFGNMSERAAKLLKEEVVSLGMVRLRDVDGAQLAIINLAKQLAENGEIVLVDRKSSEDEMIS